MTTANRNYLSRRGALRLSAGLGLGLAAPAAIAGCGTVAPASPGRGTADPAHPASGAGRAATAPPAGGGSSSAGPASGSTSPASPTPAAELPRGGTRIFPRYRLVGYCGYPGSPALGRLGTGDLDERAAEIERRGKAYTDGRELLPVLELIGTIVQGSPGPDGTWSSRAPAEVVQRHLAAARRHRALLLINIQPGRSDFLTECRYFEKWLTQPDVGVALDPEWAMQPGQVPGRAYGHTSGAELDRVAAYLAGLTTEHGLPEKVMVFHQVAASVVHDEHRLRAHRGVAIVKSVDGLGVAGAKVHTYRTLTADLSRAVHPGFKLFFSEDTRGSSRLMSTEEVLALTPRPEYVMYE